MHAVTAVSLTVQKIVLPLSQAAPIDEPQIDARINHAQGTVSLIIRGGNQFDDMFAVFAFYSGRDKSRPYSFKPNDGIFKARCRLEKNGEVSMRVIVGPERPERRATSEGLLPNASGISRSNLRDERLPSHLMPERRATSADLSWNYSGIPHARLRDDRLSGHFTNSDDGKQDLTAYLKRGQVFASRNSLYGYLDRRDRGTSDGESGNESDGNSTNFSRSRASSVDSLSQYRMDAPHQFGSEYEGDTIDGRIHSPSFGFFESSDGDPPLIAQPLERAVQTVVPKTIERSATNPRSSSPSRSTMMQGLGTLSAAVQSQLNALDSGNVYAKFEADCNRINNFLKENNSEKGLPGSLNSYLLRTLNAFFAHHDCDAIIAAMPKHKSPDAQGIVTHFYWIKARLEKDLPWVGQSIERSATVPQMKAASVGKSLAPASHSTP